MIKNIEIRVSNKFVQQQRGRDTIYFKGIFYHQTRFLCGEEAVSKLWEIYPDIPEFGFFAIIYCIDNKVNAFADRIRSYPLFYYVNKYKIVLIDSVNHLKEDSSIFKTKKDGFNLNLFWTSGFTLNSSTLLENIYQIPAGSLIEIATNTSEILLKSYYSYKPTYNHIADSLNVTFSSTLEVIFKRLIEYANGKQIVIPLSGGLDSRLIACYIKHLDYKNVLCFSYGTKKSNDVLKSQQIANQLGFKWEFIEYNRRKWQALIRENAFNKYLEFAGNLSSLPHIQDFLAIKELKENGIIENDAIIVPGHTGDFISGGHIPASYGKIEFLNTSQIIDDIITKHFRVNNINNINGDFKKNLRARISEGYGIEDEQNIDVSKAAGIYENFDWAERQSKFIINSVRVYDFFNLKWYLPLWDQDFVNYWSKRSLEDKINKRLYKQQLEQIFPGYFKGINRKHFSLKEKHKHKKLLYGIICFGKALQLLYIKKTKTIKDYFNHPFQWYGLFSFFKVLRKRGFQNINSYLVEFYLNEHIDEQA